MKKIITIVNLELLKLKHQRFPLLSLIFTFLFTILIAFFRKKLSQSAIPGMGDASGWQILSFAASWGLQIAALLILILSINLIADEFSDRTIKNLLTRPMTRTQFFIGKIATIGVVVLIFLTVIFIASFIAGALAGKMGHLQERGYIIATGGTLLKNIILAYFLSILTLATVGVFGAAIAILIPKSGIAIGVSICLYFILNLASQFEQISNFLFTTFTNFPINVAKEITYGLATPWTPSIYWCFLTSIGTSLILIVLAVTVLKRKDILS